MKLSAARVANETVSVFEELPCWPCAIARDAPAADVPGVEDIAQIYVLYLQSRFKMVHFIS